jgi:hypothetical protein
MTPCLPLLSISSPFLTAPYPSTRPHRTRRLESPNVHLHPPTSAISIFLFWSPSLLCPIHSHSTVASPAQRTIHSQRHASPVNKQNTRKQCRSHSHTPIVPPYKFPTLQTSRPRPAFSCSVCQSSSSFTPASPRSTRSSRLPALSTYSRR